MAPPSNRRIAALKRQLTRLDLICSGTLLERTKLCGKPGCRCAQDLAQRHGPYYEWNRRENGVLRHRVVSPAEARNIRRAQRNHRRLRRLLARWEDESLQTLLGRDRLKHRKIKT
jgi:hypothetical protein